eukprot:1187429-Prorocentrum_minimum.AAC.1
MKTNQRQLTVTACFACCGHRLSPEAPSDESIVRIPSGPLCFEHLQRVPDRMLCDGKYDACRIAERMSSVVEPSASGKENERGAVNLQTRLQPLVTRFTESC